MTWRVGESGLLSVPQAIAQTTDGYIWIGTLDGLYSFDGVRFARWSPVAGDPLPDQDIDSLLGARDGSLYIATQLGLARLTRGRLYRYPGKGRWAGVLMEDAQGGIWTGQRENLSAVTACRVGDTDLTCFGSNDGSGCRHGTALLSEKPGSLWVGSYEGICHWQAEAKPETWLLPALSTDKQTLSNIDALALGPGGTFWAGSRGLGPGRGLLAFSGGQWRSYVAGQIDGRTLPVTALFPDRDGSLWIGTEGKGLYKFNQGRLDHFETADGLESNSVKQIFEDKEGDLWVLTNGGVEVFRDLPVISYTTRSGLDDDNAQAIATAPDGSVWIGTLYALNIFRNGIFSHIRRGHGLPIDNVSLLFRDLEGRIWMSGGLKLFLCRQDRFLPVTGPGGTGVHLVASMAEDNHHDIWVSDLDIHTHSSLLRLKGLQIAERISTPGGQTVFLAPNPRGGLWVGGFRRGLFWFHDGQFEPLKTIVSGKSVYDLFSEANGALWIFTLEHEIFEYKDGKTQELTVRNGLPCNTGYGVLDDRSGNHWFYLQCGIVRVSNAELGKWWDNPAYHMQTTVFDSLDGAQPTPTSDELIALPDGRLWSATTNGVELIDTKHLPWNPLPPPVHIDRVVVDRRNYPTSGGFKIPPSPRDLEIDYTGLSYVVPEKVQFRYRLQGRDDRWIDAGTRRQAFYTDPKPGHYTFQVVACNNDGVWNEVGASLSFVIEPAWYQNGGVRLLALLSIVLLGYALYLLRMRQYAAAMRARFGERLDERLRIARELHDTLLQSFHGLMFQFQAARNLLPRKPESAMQTLDKAILATEHAIAEGRDAIRDLRPEPAAQRDLAELLTAAGQELAAAQSANGHLPAFRVIVEGKPLPLSPMLQGEIYRIGREVIRNAFHHAAASNIEVEVLYDEHQLRLRIRDDGKGIDPKDLQARGRPGHWGLPGIRERAQRIGSRVEFWSEAGAGTEMELRVPAAIAYEKQRNGHRFRLFHRGGSRGRRP